MMSEKAFTFHGLLKRQELPWPARLNLARKVLLAPGSLPSIQVHMTFDALCTLLLDYKKCAAADDDHIAQVWLMFHDFFADLARSRDLVRKPLFSKSLLSCLRLAASASSDKTPAYLLPMAKCACELSKGENTPVLLSKLSELSEAVEKSLIIWLDSVSRGDRLAEIEILLTTFVRRYLALKTFWPTKKERFVYVCDRLIPIMAKSCFVNADCSIREEILNLIAELVFEVAYAEDYDAYLCTQKEAPLKKKARKAKQTESYAWMLFEKLQEICATDNEQQKSIMRLYPKLFHHYALKFSLGSSLTNRCLLLFSLYGYRLGEGTDRTELGCQLLCCINKFKMYNTYEDSENWAEWFFSIRDEMLDASARCAEFYISMEELLQVHPPVVTLKVKDILIATRGHPSSPEQLPEKVAFLVSLISYYGKTSQLESLFEVYAEVLVDFAGNIEMSLEEYRAFQVAANGLKQAQMNSIIDTTVGKCLLLLGRQGKHCGHRCLQMLTLFGVVSASCRSVTLEHFFKLGDTKPLLDLLYQNAGRSDEWRMCALAMAKTLVSWCVTNIAWHSVSTKAIENVGNYLSSLLTVSRSDCSLSVLLLVYLRIANTETHKTVARDVVDLLAKESQQEGLKGCTAGVALCQSLFEWSSALLGVCNEKYRQKFLDAIVLLAFVKCDNRLELMLSDAALWEEAANVRCLVKAYIGLIAEQLKGHFPVGVEIAVLRDDENAYLVLCDYLRGTEPFRLHKSANLEPLRRIVNHLLIVPLETTDSNFLRTLVMLLLLAFKNVSSAWRKASKLRDAWTDLLIAVGRVIGSLLPCGFVEKQTDVQEGPFLSELLLLEGLRNLECAWRRGASAGDCDFLQRTVIAFWNFYLQQWNATSRRDDPLAYVEALAKESSLTAVRFLPVADHFLRMACRGVLSGEFDRELCQRTINVLTGVATELWERWECAEVDLAPLGLVKTLLEFSSRFPEDGSQAGSSLRALLCRVDAGVEKLISSSTNWDFENFENTLRFLVALLREGESVEVLKKHVLVSLRKGPRDFCSSPSTAELLQRARSFGEITGQLWPTLAEDEVKTLFGDREKFPSAWLLFLALSTSSADRCKGSTRSRFLQRCRSILFNSVQCVQLPPKDNAKLIRVFSLICRLFKLWLSKSWRMQRGVDQLVDACHTLLASLPLNSLFEGPEFDVLFSEELTLASLTIDVHSSEVLSRIPSFVEALRRLQSALHRHCRFKGAELEAHAVCTQMAYEMRRLLVKVTEYMKDFARVAVYVLADFVHFCCAEPLCQRCMQEVLPGYLELHRCFDVPSLSMLATNLSGAERELYATLFVGVKRNILER